MLYSSKQSYQLIVILDKLRIFHAIFFTISYILIFASIQITGYIGFIALVIMIALHNYAYLSLVSAKIGASFLTDGIYLQVIEAHKIENHLKDMFIEYKTIKTCNWEKAKYYERKGFFLYVKFNH